jgi:hypothetical protein
MEVHHHPKVEKKKFTEYLLEGLMIFIAVTLGFFAESLREHINDNEKEHKYIVGLIRNLEQDETDLDSTIKENQWKLNGLDSLLSLSFKNISDPVNKQLLYKYFGLVSYYSAFHSNDATMIQLKNAGGLQYIRRKHIADSIARYDEVVSSIYAAEAPYAKALNDAMDAISEILVFRVLRDTAYFKNGAYTSRDLPLLTNDNQKVEMFFNKISLERGWTQNYLINLQERLPYAIKLTRLLKKEYEVD